MQQVKKELQDAIKELKSEWGIQNANREKLASILEKVSAAVDRAAALPLPDGGGILTSTSLGSLWSEGTNTTIREAAPWGLATPH